ncbi:hypothetical protein ACFP47_01535 [Nesterenkonia lacusekhoensis]|uniref:Uncharacterized protein n=1 Tax=Nesterenkonia lacusekhoensis TaxID=150832 RepID=A0ABS4T4W4_9MICC|nr:hypothetical protein [Nesterenkonia lacusekhoensis]MBP2319472.1 hypothetical protein [Nesterenkonia lacusekhoensis]
MTTIAYLNSPHTDPEVHAADCSNITRRTRMGFEHAGCAEVTTRSEAIYDYNADFIDDGATNDELWDLLFFPCAKLGWGSL